MEFCNNNIKWNWEVQRSISWDERNAVKEAKLEVPELHYCANPKLKGHSLAHFKTFQVIAQHLNMWNIWTFQTFEHFKHLNISNIWTCQTFEHFKHLNIWALKHFKHLNMWNIWTCETFEHVKHLNISKAIIRSPTAQIPNCSLEHFKTFPY